jgi:hypothetical protein
VLAIGGARRNGADDAELAIVVARNRSGRSFLDALNGGGYRKSRAVKGHMAQGRSAEAESRYSDRCSTNQRSYEQLRCRSTNGDGAASTCASSISSNDVKPSGSIGGNLDLANKAALCRSGHRIGVRDGSGRCRKVN